MKNGLWWGIVALAIALPAWCANPAPAFAAAATPAQSAPATPAQTASMPVPGLPSSWQAIIWQGELTLASFDLVKSASGRYSFQAAPAVNLGWAGYIPLPNPNFSFVFGGAAGESTGGSSTFTVRPYVGVGYGGDAKLEPSVQFGLCPPLVVIQDGTFEVPRFSLCSGGALPIL